MRQTSKCTKREFEKNFQGSRELPQAHEKVCDERRRKNDCRVKKKFVEGRIYKAVSEDWLNRFR